MRTLVTGSTGFIGGHLCSHLLERGHGVVAVVRQAGTAPAGTQELVIDDIGPDTNWGRSLDDIDVVIHLAARVHVMRETESDALAQYRRVNRDGTLSLAHAAAAAGVRRFVFLSSIKVNGEQTRKEPFTVRSEPAPVDPYGISKWEAEQRLGEMARDGAVDVVSVRTPLVFGPGVGGNFRRLLDLVSREVPLPLGSVRNARSMMAVENLVDLLEYSATREGKTEASELVLASQQPSPSTPELLRAIASALGVRSRLIPFPTALLRFAGRVLGQGAAVQRLVESLEVQATSTSESWDWVAPVAFPAALQRTADWYRLR